MDPIASTTFGRNRDSIRFLTTDCQRAFLASEFFDSTVANFIQHYHAERNHQGLGNELIEPDEQVGSTAGSLNAMSDLGACSSTITAGRRKLLNANGMSRVPS